MLLCSVCSARVQAAGACSTPAMQASDGWPACVHGRYLRGVTRWSVVLLREPEDGRPKDSDLRLRAPLMVASAGRAGRSSKRRRCVRLPWHRCMAVVATSGQAHTCGVPLWWLWIACQGMACHQVMGYLAMGKRVHWRHHVLWMQHLVHGPKMQHSGEGLSTPACMCLLCCAPQ